MLKIILLVLAVAVAGVLVAAAMQPDSFHIQREALIKAPPEKIYAILEDFDRSQEWSPYEKKDPAMKRARSGAARGKGAVYAFEGNSEVGQGKLEITDATPPSRLVLRLDMVKPFEGSNVIEYRLEPERGGTNVTWAMKGTSPFLSKVICLFMNMDKMVGKDFEAGLASLRTLAER